MRKVYTAFILFVTMLFGAMAIGQEQQKSYINYQGVARNADGALMNNESLSIGVKLKFGSSSSEIAYEESHSLTTDGNGVFSLLIGNGSSADGDYIGLPWGEFATYATVSINGSEIGTTELMAVPHALSSADNQWHTMGNDIENKNGGNVFVTGSLYASKDFSLAEGTAVNEFSTDITLGSNSDEIVPTQKAVKTYVDSQFGGGGGGADDQTAAEVAYDNSTSGLTANTAQAAIDELVTSGSVDADSDPNNEIQTLSFDLATSELSLTDGGSVILPSGGTDADADPNNEIQDISLSGTELTISEGSTIDLAPIVPPGGTDDQNAAEVPYDNTTSGLTATNAKAAIDELATGGLVDTDDQDLILAGDVLTIEDGAGSVDLSAYKDKDATTKTGILLGDGTAISGLVGTADGQVAKWNAGTSKWEAGTDATGGGGSSLWTDNGGDIYFNTGNVGIGENNPTAKLEIAGDLKLEFGPSINEIDTDFKMTQNSDKVIPTQKAVKTALAGLVGGRWSENGNDFYYNIGNVGIGTGSPTTELDIDGNIRLRDLSGVGQRNVVADANGNLVIGTGNGGSSIWSKSGSDIFYNDGDVGIGTNNPEAKLQVEGDLFVNSSQGRLKIGYPNNGHQWHLSTIGGGDVLQFRSKPSGSNNLKTRFRMEQTGEFKFGDISGKEAWVHVRKNTTVNKPHIKIEEQGNDYARLELTNTVSNAVWHVAGLANNNPANSFLNFYFRSATGVAKNLMAITGSGNVLVDGSLAHSSDIRLKKNIEELPYGLKEILQFEPKIYGWKDNRNDGSRSLGLIAQKVRQIIPEIVHEKDDAEKTLSLSYTELIPVMVSAIKEQHEIIGDQSKRISDLEERLKKLEAKIGN